MYERGHAGFSLVLYTPFVVWWIKPAYGIFIAGVGVAFMVVFCMVPDLDMKIPVIKHRGILHTLWFAAVTGLVGWFVGSHFGMGLLAGVLSFLAIWSHILGDAFTPMGIEPFYPLSERTYTLDLWKAESKFGNTVLLVLGILLVSWGLDAGTRVLLDQVTQYVVEYTF